MTAGVAHIGLFCSDLEGIRAFYEKYFDALCNDKYTNLAKGFESYILSFGNGACQLEIMRKADVTAQRQPTTLGLAHVSFSVGSKENVDALTERLKADGYSVIDGPRTTGDGFYESAVLDPEGNHVEITV